MQEVHLFISGQYLVTIHHEPLAALDEQRLALAGRVLHSEQFVLYRGSSSTSATTFVTSTTT